MNQQEEKALTLVSEKKLFIASVTKSFIPTSCNSIGVKRLTGQGFGLENKGVYFAGKR